ncbi:uncharacterized protein LOC114789268 isoform X2 [Denticeps clupeoides]|uniref:uncharacterized protein LOC114789268 isoform X2 n=1 Tax=Denticeps clupeoides TaxID=299321 RepID=UPI0010A3326D|nr:uncharacterized protein LOC114789268 isoform X2 [Denticeps clupeoides]
MLRFVLDCLRPSRQRAGERDISLDKVATDIEGCHGQRDAEVTELQDVLVQEQTALEEQRVQTQETQQALEQLVQHRKELKEQIALIQEQRSQERHLLLSLQEEKDELELSMQEYEEELSRTQEELKRLQEEVRHAGGMVKDARVQIGPLQDSIRQSYTEISRAQQRLGELIAELIAVEGNSAVDTSLQVGPITAEDVETEMEEEEKDEDSEQDDHLLQEHEEEEQTGLKSKEEIQKPRHREAIKSSGSSSFTEITLTEVKEEGQSSRSVTPQQIESPGLEEEDIPSVQSLMTQSTNCTVIGLYDFYHPDPFPDDDLFKYKPFPKLDIYDAFSKDPFKGTDPFASDILFSQVSEELALQAGPFSPTSESVLSDPECPNYRKDGDIELQLSVPNGIEPVSDTQEDSIAPKPNPNDCEVGNHETEHDSSGSVMISADPSDYKDDYNSDASSDDADPDFTCPEPPTPEKIHPDHADVSIELHAMDSRSLEFEDCNFIKSECNNVGLYEPVLCVPMNYSLSCEVNGCEIRELDYCDLLNSDVEQYKHMDFGALPCQLNGSKIKEHCMTSDLTDDEACVTVGLRQDFQPANPEIDGSWNSSTNRYPDPFSPGELEDDPNSSIESLESNDESDDSKMENDKKFEGEPGVCLVNGPPVNSHPTESERHDSVNYDPFRTEFSCLVTSDPTYSGMEMLNESQLLPEPTNPVKADRGTEELHKPLSPDPFGPMSNDIRPLNSRKTLPECRNAGLLDFQEEYKCDSDHKSFSSHPSCDSSRCDLSESENQGDVQSKETIIFNFEVTTHQGLSTELLQSNSEDSDLLNHSYFSYDSSKPIRCESLKADLSHFDPFSPEPSDAEMSDVGTYEGQSGLTSETNIFNSWGLDPSMFPPAPGSPELTNTGEGTPMGTSSDTSIRGHPFDSESSDAALRWSLSESEGVRSADQTNEDQCETPPACSSLTEVDPFGSEQSKSVRSSRHNSVHDSIAEMLFGPEPNTARFYPWDIENSNIILCDALSPSDAPEMFRCEHSFIPNCDIKSGIRMSSSTSECPNLR